MKCYQIYLLILIPVYDLTQNLVKCLFNLSLQKEDLNDVQLYYKFNFNKLSAAKKISKLIYLKTWLEPIAYYE